MLDLENKVHTLLFNIDLQNPASEISNWVERVPYIIVILMVVATALFQQKQITKKQGKSDNPQAQQMQMIGKVMPVFFGFISWTLPSGLVIYFLTGNIFRIGQQALIIRIEDKNETNDEKHEKEKDQTEDKEENNQQEQDPRKNRKKRRRK